ncbi:adhesive plaque matrix protein-like [Aedes aegypti]|uniref:Uncharacterized protein n=1 Tax=Aedes aegypti TaxID=7159 RepID=A0A6I8U943_AEDAE|nr:adhesive plaque matrix protein-like [Aedes aegypti]
MKMWTELITAACVALMVSGESNSRIDQGMIEDSSLEATRTGKQSGWQKHRPRIYPYPEYDYQPEPQPQPAYYPRSELYHNPQSEPAYYAQLDPAYHGHPELTFYSKYDPTYYPKYVSYEQYRPSYDTKPQPCGHESTKTHTHASYTTHAPHTTYPPHSTYEPHTTYAPQTTTYSPLALPSLPSLPVKNPLQGLIISDLLNRALSSTTQRYNYDH